MSASFQLNINGINEASQLYKIKALEEMIHSCDKYIPFFVIGESHLKTRNRDVEIAIKDYATLRSDRPVVYKGGVVIYTHKDFVVDDHDTYADKVCQIAMIYNSTNNLILAGIYRPPGADSNSFHQCLEKFEQFVSKHKDADIHLYGDFNMRFIDWKTKELNSGSYEKSDKLCAQELLKSFETHMLNQLVKEPTRKDKSILDLVITNNIDSVHCVEVDKTQLSDHDIVWCNLLYKKMTKIPPENNDNKDSPLDSVNLNKADWTEIRSELSQINWKEILENKVVEEMHNIIENKIVNVCVNHAPQHQSDGKKKQNIPKARRTLLNIRKKTNAKIRLAKYLKKPGYENNIIKLEKKKASLEIGIRDSIREESLRKEINAIKKIKTNSRAFYTYAKQKSKTHTNIGPLIDDKNVLHSDSATMSNLLQEQYKKAFSNPDSGIIDQSYPDSKHVPPLNTITVTNEDIIKAINSISNNSAPGPDKIPAVLLKECKNEIAPALSLLWQKSIDTGEIPSKLLTQCIIPIFKKDNRSLPSNYRPISLTSHLIKIFERILRAKITEHLEKHQLITKHQHGFTPNRSTLTQILHHLHSILEILEDNGNADILYLDLSKAFDKVNHRILLHKLEKMNITGKINNWVKTFLTTRSQYVVVNGKKSEPAHVKSGVPQGTVLGPALFIIYMNNITEVVNSTIIKMFADDSKLISSVKSPEDRNKIITDLTALINWTENNSMQFNDTKFQLLQIGPNKDLKLPYMHNNKEIKGSDHVRDLGVYISHDLSNKYQITEMTTQANNFASWLLRTFVTRDPEPMLLLLKTYIIPRVEYLSAVWNPHKIGEIQQIEAVQRSFTAKIKGMEDLNYHERLKHLKLFSLQRRRERFIIIHTHKIFLELAPNDVNIQFHDHQRLGTQCRRLPLKSKITSVNTIRDNFFSHNSPKLYNLVPKSIKCARNIASFKRKLDNFLMKIPDFPPIPGYICANSNSLTEWVPNIQQAKLQIVREESDSQNLLYKNVEVSKTLDVC